MTSIEIVTQALEVVAALAAAPLFLGWINQCRAWLQNRRAPSVWLPYRGLRKLFFKDAVIAQNSSPLFWIAPPRCAGKAMMRTVVSGTKTGDVLVRIEELESQYMRLKKLYEQCVLDGDCELVL